MFIEDGSEVDWHTCGKLAYKPDFPNEFKAIAIGWLGIKVKSRGTIDKQLYDKLKWYSKNQAIEKDVLGEHQCECDFYCEYKDKGEFVVDCDNQYYVLPQMVFHYMAVHHYLPPASFLEVLSKLELPT